MQEFWERFGSLAVVAAVLAVGWMAVDLVYRALRAAIRRMPAANGGRAVLEAMLRRGYRPSQLLVGLVGSRFAVLAVTDPGNWRNGLLHALLIAAIVAGGWLVASLLLAIADHVLARFPIEAADNYEARRAHTQVVIIRRLSLALVSVLTLGVALTTFEAIRAFGATLLASAGLAGVIAGLAAQTTLGNLFAGLQLVFGDALRIDDVVVVEGEWGRIEEITLSYVVVNIWDQRRMILPTSYFTSTPFTSWTRRDAQILGTVELELDWSIPVAEMRAELERYVRDHPLWDGRSVGLQVTGATGAAITVRALVSARDGSAAWDLRCAVREHLVEWVRINHPDSLPRMRTEITTCPVEATT